MIRMKSCHPRTRKRPPDQYWGSQKLRDGPHFILEDSISQNIPYSMRYHTERQFYQHTQSKAFFAIFTSIIKQRLENRLWADHAPPENILRVLQCLRILMRDAFYQKQFIDMNGIATLAEYLKKATNSYLTYGDSPFVVDILTQTTNIFQKLSAQVSQRELLIKYSVHQSLVLLLWTSDVVVLHCSLHALIGLAQSPEPRTEIAALNSIEMLLRIIQDFDIMSKKLAANLLRLLCGDCQAREMVKIYDGIPILLSVLQSDGVKLLIYVVWCLVQLSEDPDASNEIRQRGGIPLLLTLLGDRKFVSDRSIASGFSCALKSPAILEEDPFINLNRDSISCAPTHQNQAEEMKDYQLNLKSACCACLTELVLNDTNAQQIVQSNGIYLLGQLILPNESSEKEVKAMNNLQANAFRTLRFLFSMERNRQLFMRLFPSSMFEKFIDIGHYNKDIKAYNCLVDIIKSLDTDAVSSVSDNLDLTNQNREATRKINDYFVHELLGSGGYGSVYKVKKAAGQSYLAMKEINTTTAAWGTSTKERMKSVGDVVNELTIIKEQLKHPNVVRYYKTFIEQDRLYIIMELIEGAPIGEHFKSLKEKNERFSEDRIWHIFIQLVLALRYLHKDKKIVHRDLTPNNIMLGEGDRVTITDFGLAKVKQGDCSKMLSQVGTILYACPEVIQHKPYGEKADIWAIGCVLYQMCTLNPPFCSNLLTLALKIVDADYDPIPAGHYSEKVISTVRLCINADPDKRPDIVGVASYIADILLVHMDSVKKSQNQMEKKLENERRKTRKNFSEASRGMQHYHQLYTTTQENYDKLVNLAGSGGGSSIKDESDTGESVFSDPESGTIKGQGNSNGQDTALTSVENGWGTDEDQYSSGSECHSRESSAGLSGRTDPMQGLGSRMSPYRPDFPPGPKYKQIGMENLTLEIPAAKYSRDSGISSGDPSPNNSSPPGGSIESQDGVFIDGMRRPRSYHGGQTLVGSPTLEGMERRGVRARPCSAATPTLTISQRKVREINDPILQILHQLHKIIYITQLPPNLSHNARRRVIERYKRALFAPQSTSANLKNELQKLMTGSQEVIDLNLGPLDDQVSTPTVISQQSSQDRVKRKPSDGQTEVVYEMDPASDFGITYEQMQNLIEKELFECGYYNMPPQTRNRNIPMPPLRSLSTPYGKYN